MSSWIPPSAHATHFSKVDSSCFLRGESELVRLGLLFYSCYCNISAPTTSVGMRCFYEKRNVILIGDHLHKLSQIQLEESLATKFQKKGPQLEPCRHPTLYSCTKFRMSVRYNTFLSDRKLFTNLNRFLRNFIFPNYSSKINGHHILLKAFLTSNMTRQQLLSQL